MGVATRGPGGEKVGHRSGLALGYSLASDWWPGLSGDLRILAA
jgi:hypothetical protein